MSPRLIRRATVIGAAAVACLVTPRLALAYHACGPQTAAIPSICQVAPTVCTLDDYPAFDICTGLPQNNNASDVWSSDGRHTYQTNVGSCYLTDNNWGYQCVELGRRYFRFRWGVTSSWGTVGFAEDMCGAYPHDQVTITTDPVAGDLMIDRSGPTANWSDDPACHMVQGGHVAVVNAVSADGQTITVINQNFESQGKESSIARSCADCVNWGSGNVCGCFLHANVNVPLCKTLPAPPDPVPTGLDQGLDFACGTSLRDNGQGWNDWAYYRFKAACGLSQAATGLSMSKTDKRYAHELLCRAEDPARYPHTADNATCHAVVFNVADNRGTDSTGNWDPDYLKGECAADEFVAGISQSQNQALYSILCCQGQVTHELCTPRAFADADAREDPGANDWDPDYYKGECGPGRYVAGVSMTPLTGIPHAILCCGLPVEEPPEAGVGGNTGAGGNAGGSPTGGASAAPAGEVPDSTDSGGCGCHTGRSGRFDGWAWLALACAASLASCRRRARASR